MNKEPLSLTGFFAEDVKALLDARLRGAKAGYLTNNAHCGGLVDRNVRRARRGR